MYVNYLSYSRALMCICWPRLCVAAHILCSIIYIVAGAVQLIAGIFFLISLPIFKVGSNLWTGGWNVLVGVAGAVFTCVGDLTPSKHQKLLYLTISVIAVNVFNLVILEIGEWRILMPDSVEKLIQQKNLQTVVFYARFTTSISTAVTVVTSFLDAQLMFCWLERNLRSRTQIHHNETVSDIEYIIPRAKSSSMGKNNSHNMFNQYAQSWVFDTDTVGSSQSDSPYSKMPPQFTGSKTVVLKRKQHQQECNNVPSDTPVQPVVLVEEVSNSDRQLQFMTSFSRTPSPVGMSDSSSQSSNPPHIYECLERLTEPSVYRSRLNTALTANIERPSPSVSPRPHSAIISDPVQYASLMMELEKTIVAKFPPVKSPANLSESLGSSRRSSSRDESLYKSLPSDVEFSKELEAALQLIQDLESPNTVDTPSEGPMQHNLGEESDSGASSKTLSEAVPMPGKECTVRITGSNTTVINLHPNKKYTSIVNIVSPDNFGFESEENINYTSDTKDIMLRTFTSCSNNENNDKVILDVSNTKSNCENDSSNEVDSISCNQKPSYQDSPPSCKVEYNNNIMNSDSIKFKGSNVQKTNSFKHQRWSLKNILKRKPSQLKLCPELENTLLKSESLIHLTENELVARYNRDKLIHRVRDVCNISGCAAVL
uniref:Uncharacterized protein n=2 Tax=Clastoptera arizonana TaxID=38151 RepID=A0A1B6DGG9_9HEMI